MPVLENAFRLGLALLAITFTAQISGAQFHTYDRWEIHYIALNTTFLTPKIAATYGITRGPDRGLVNISVLEDGQPVARPLRGSFRNLLGQTTTLRFEEVREGESVYYLAPFRFQDRETLRFELEVTFPCEVDVAFRSSRCERGDDGEYVHVEQVRFQQALHVDD